MKSPRPLLSPPIECPTGNRKATPENSGHGPERPIAPFASVEQDALSKGTVERISGRTLRRLRNGLAVGKLLPAYALFGVLKHLLPLKHLARWAWRDPIGPRDREVERQLIGSLLRLSRLAGLWDRDCLQCSLLLYRALSRMGAEPTLFIGFHHASGRTVGHAWVVVDDRAVIDSPVDLLRFSAVAGFGRRGVPLSFSPPQSDEAV